MYMFTYFQQEQLQRGIEYAIVHRPELAELVGQANKLLLNVGEQQSFAIYGRPEFAKKFPWSKTELVKIHFELLWGEVSESCELQTMVVGEFGSYESYLMGVINGMAWAARNAPTQEQIWDDFMDRLALQDGVDTINFLGSINRYKKIFIGARK